MNVPSTSQGFSRSAAEAENPGLWDGLVFLGVTSIGPTGLQIADLSGYGLRPAISGAVAGDWLPFSGGWSHDLNGAGAIWTIGSPGHLAFSGKPSMSFAAWVNFDATPDYGGILDNSLSPLGGTNARITFGTYSNRQRLWLGDGAVMYSPNGNTVLATGIWYLVGFHLAGGMFRFWLNGRPDSNLTTHTTDPAASSEPWRIGVGFKNSVYANCKIANPAIWRRALLPQEWDLLYRVPESLIQLGA